VVVHQEDIGFPCTIESITYVRPNGGYGWAGGFSMKMAHVSIDELSETFADNFTPGTLEEVAFIDSLPLYGGAGSQLTIQFDQPFYYNGTDNLLIDIHYPDGMVEAGVYNWTAGPARNVCSIFPPGGSPDPSGDLSNMVPYMILECEMALGACTFGHIKIILGGAD
jgi:hypothetical protein